MAKNKSLDDHAGKEEEFKINPRLTSFLDKDDSFLSPWNWDSNAIKKTQIIAGESESSSNSHPKVNRSVPSARDDKVKGLHPKSDAFKNETIAGKSETSNPQPVNQSVPSARNMDGKGKDLFTKVQDLRPNKSDGVNLLVKYVKLQKKSPKGQRRVVECFVGDETAMIVFKATDGQVDVVKPGSTLMLYNAKIHVIKRNMILMVPTNGRIEVQDQPASFTVKEDNNMSIIEWERVDVVI